MKEKSRQELYDNLSHKKKRKRALEWCMKLLRVDIDKLPDAEFYKIVSDYEAIVAYPELGFYYFTPGLFTGINNEDIEEPDPSQQERIVRTAFKHYQKAAIEIMSDFEKMMDKPGHWVRWGTEIKFTSSANRQGLYSIHDKAEHDFEYSYARQIAKALDGKKFNDVFHICAYDKCSNYFVVLSNHKQECCNHKCSVLLNKTKMFGGDEEKAKKFRKLESFYYRVKKMSISYTEKHALLRKHIKKNNYEAELISPAIRKFLNTKFEN